MRALKLSLALIGVALLVAAVTGCGGGGTTPPPLTGYGLVTVDKIAGTASFTPTEGTTVSYVFGEFTPVSPPTNDKLQNVAFTQQPNGTWLLSFTDDSAFSYNQTGTHSGTYLLSVFALIPGLSAAQPISFTSNPGEITLQITITSSTSPPPPPIFPPPI
ncbi:MAG: hypothetical protein ACYC7E_13400 [Armatimonadota bacterium]